MYEWVEVVQLPETTLRHVIHLQVLDNHQTVSFVKKKSLSNFFWDNKKLWSLHHPSFFFQQRCDTVGWLVGWNTVDAWMAGAAAAGRQPSTLGVAGYFGWLDRIFRSTYQRTRQPTCGSIRWPENLCLRNSMGFWSHKGNRNCFFFLNGLPSFFFK